MDFRVPLLVVLTVLSRVPSAVAQEPGSRESYSAFIEKYRAHILSVMKENSIAGACIAVTSADSMIWCEGFGYYDDQGRTNVSGHTPFFIGSICKVFTGLAVMQLCQEGKVSLDVPLSTYLPQFAVKTRFGSTDGITARLMMTHHSGIPDFVRNKLTATPPPFTTVLNIVNEDYATYPPNTIFSYSNAGVSLLGNVIQEVSGESYFTYLREHLLEPLHMDESGFFIGEGAPASVELGYDSRGKELRELPVVDAPAGCVYSSAFDMAKFMRMILHFGRVGKRRVIDSVALEEMMRVQNDTVFLDFGKPTGLVWNVYENAAGRCIEHAGGSIAHRAELCIAPESGLGIIMMSNSASGGKMMYAENYDMFTDLMKLRNKPSRVPPNAGPKNRRHPQHDFVFQKGKVPTRELVPLSTLREYSGSYGSFGYIIPLTMSGQSLRANLFGKDVALLSVAPAEFAPVEVGDSTVANARTRLYFERAGDALLLVQCDEWGNHSILGEKMTPVDLAAPWTRRIGLYCDDGDPGTFQMFSNFQLLQEEGVLCLGMKFNIEGLGPPALIAPLKILNDSLAVVYGYGRFSGQAVQFRSSGGSIEAMKFMGYTCVKQ